MPKFRWMVCHEGIIDADDERDAEERALALADGGFALTIGVQVEAIGEETDEHERC